MKPSTRRWWKGHGDLRGTWDADRLAQIVSNLAGNAIQHGQGTPITLTCEQHGDSVTLAVHNRGPAIPPDMLPFVFEPLARGDAARAGGNGESRPTNPHHRQVHSDDRC